MSHTPGYPMSGGKSQEFFFGGGRLKDIEYFPSVLTQHQGSVPFLEPWLFLMRQTKSVIKEELLEEVEDEVLRR